jgi:SAM-dependent methyltransferase
MGTDNQGQYGALAGEKVLDVGCGSGASLLELQMQGVHAFGVEADPNVEQLARDLGLRVHRGNLYDHPFAELQFDRVVFNQVLEHLPDPEMALVEASRRLSGAGRIFVVVPNRRSVWCRLSGERWINWHIPYHQHHFDISGIELLAKRCGLRIVRWRTITPNLWTLMQWYASRQRVKQGRASPLWKSVPKMDGARRPLATVSRRVRQCVHLALILIVAPLNRAIDLSGGGDSLLVELRPERLP